MIESLISTIWWGIDPGVNGALVGVKFCQNLDTGNYLSVNDTQLSIKVIASERFHKPKQLYFNNWLKGGVLDINLINSLIEHSDIYSGYEDDNIINYFSVEFPVLIPKVGIKSTFITGLNYGILLNSIVTYLENVEFVYPTDWTKFFKGLIPRKDKLKLAIAMRENKKELSKYFFNELVSKENYICSSTITDGITDAFCIALYGALKNHKVYIWRNE